MAESKEARNKGLVLKAFDTLFNKRDYSAAERFWSPDYIQHIAHIGRVALGTRVLGFALSHCAFRACK